MREQAANSRKILASHDNPQEEVDGKSLKERATEEARAVKAALADAEREEAAALTEIEELALQLPNLTSEDTPIGDEAAIMSYLNDEPGEAPKLQPKPARSHVDIGTELGIIDFAGASKASGWGWYYLIGDAAKLEQALIQYALSVVTKYGWTQVSPPSMVYSHIGAACGFQPRDQHGEQQVYTIAQSEADKDRKVPEMCLTGTSEISLAGMKAMTTIEVKDLPIRRVAVSRCYRAEAGGRGADTKGLYRVHEFTKVEMFAWTQPEAGETEDFFEEMLDIQTEILSSLGLRCRVLSMPSHDLGASATRKVDIEAWFPSRQQIKSDAEGVLQPGGRDGWGEVTSASMCTDYQTRRLATRLRLLNGKMDFPWTVNGTALAVPRVLAAILENGWDEETRTLNIPEVLQPWMEGRERIGMEETVDD